MGSCFLEGKHIGSSPYERLLTPSVRRCWVFSSTRVTHPYNVHAAADMPGPIHNVSLEQSAGMPY